MSGHRVRKRLGSLVMAGLPGTTLDAETVSLIQDWGVGAFILFARNVQDGVEPLRRLCADLREACLKAGLANPVIAVDQEGGPVQRLGPPFWPRVPSNQEVGQSPEPEVAAGAQAEAVADILRPLGIGLDLAPVLDCAAPWETGVLKDRSYGQDPSTVARLGDIFIRRLQASGVAATAKHFPGIGRVRQDPHHRRPEVDADRTLLWGEMEPFRAAIEAGVAAVMTSHVVFPALDPEAPGTFSSPIASDLLRNNFGFQGVLMTDDLEMGGITAYGSVGDAGVRALGAGHDLLLVCHRADRVREVVAAVEEALKTGSLSWPRIEVSLARLGALGRPCPPSETSAIRP